MKYLFVILICLTALPANAAKLVLEPGACDQLTKHVASPDVAYQPGFDAYGRPVAPAGLPGPGIALAPIEIPLSVSLANRIKLPSPLVADNDAYVGTVMVSGDTVTFNGQPLTDETEANLAVLCMHPNDRHD